MAMVLLQRKRLRFEALAESSAVLRISLALADSGTAGEGAGLHASEPTVLLELEVAGSLRGSWHVAPREIELPIEAGDLRHLTEDALTRVRKLVDASSPSSVLLLVLAEAQDRLTSLNEPSRKVPVPTLDRLLASVSAHALTLAQKFDERIALEDGFLSKSLVECQRLAEQFGAPVKPEQLRALRQAPAAIVDALAGAAARWVGYAETNFDTVTESRAVRVREILPGARLPPRVADELHALLKQFASNERALWLELGAPRGYLPAIRWERLLASVTPLPVLRLPYHQNDTSPGARALNVLFFCTGPTWNSVPSPQAIVDMLRAICDAVQSTRPLKLHVFVDVDCHAQVSSALERLPSFMKARTHLVSPPPQLSGATSDDEWGPWIRRELAGIAIDVLHVIVPAELVAGQPTLVIPNSPRDTKSDGYVPRRSVRSPELVRFANSLGAWSTIYTTFGSEESRLAWRLLADEVAQSRPGLVALHDFQLDDWDIYWPRLSGLAGLYRFLDRSLLPLSHPALAMYCHPRRISQDRESDPAFAPEEIPAWMAATNRSLEQLVSMSTPAKLETNMDHAIANGARAAVDFVASLILATMPSEPASEAARPNEATTPEGAR